VSGQGTFLFSDKTLYSDSTSPYRYVNVSRLLIYLIKNITPIAKRYLFEFNNSITRTSFTNSVTPILEQAKSTGGLIDYTITCDDSNNTDAVISANNFVADIKIKPAKAINYITLRFTNLNV
jgi:phage tail sheath protein FI